MEVSSLPGVATSQGLWLVFLTPPKTRQRVQHEGRERKKQEFGHPLLRGCHVNHGSVKICHHPPATLLIVGHPQRDAAEQLLCVQRCALTCSQRTLRLRQGHGHRLRRLSHARARALEHKGIRSELDLFGRGACVCLWAFTCVHSMFHHLFCALPTSPWVGLHLVEPSIPAFRFCGVFYRVVVGPASLLRRSQGSTPRGAARGNSRRCCTCPGGQKKKLSCRKRVAEMCWPPW